MLISCGVILYKGLGRDSSISGPARKQDYGNARQGIQGVWTFFDIIGLLSDSLKTLLQVDIYQKEKKKLRMKQLVLKEEF